MARRAISPEARKAGVAAFAGALSVAALGLAAVAGPTNVPRAPAPPRPAGSVELQLLGVNDFHGNLEPPRPGLGGAANLHAQLDRAERSHPGRTIRVHAGDMVGASPLVSSRFQDEPSVLAMNQMEFDAGTLGNHEFDEGGEELIRLLRGDRRFPGAAFPYTAANTIDRTGELGLPPYQVVKRAGVRVGFIGVTTLETPDYLLGQYKGRFRFADISDTVNRYARELQREGVQAIVVLAHSGARQKGDVATGEIVDEARQMSSAVDVVIAGHTHTRLNLEVSGKLIVQAKSLGAAYDRVRMTVDRRSGEVLAKSAQTPAIDASQTRPDRGTRRLVRSYARRIAPLAKRVIGRARRPLTRNGSLVALAARAQRRMARADIAVVNDGNSRAGIAAGPITYEDAFRASAYGNRILRMELTGRELKALQAQQRAQNPDVMLEWSGLPPVIDPDRTYTVAANELLVEGADDFSVLRRGRRVRPMGTDLQALVRYIERERVVG